MSFKAVESQGPGMAACLDLLDDTAQVFDAANHNAVYGTRSISSRLALLCVPCRNFWDTKTCEPPRFKPMCRNGRIGAESPFDKL